jgi:ribonucleoside-diphosphate reductase alpha chain
MAESTPHTLNGAPFIPPPADSAERSSSSFRGDLGFQVIRRNGSFSPFDASKISVAITKAFVAVEGPGATSSRRIHDAVKSLTQQIIETLSRRGDSARAIHIEDIQDQVELALMRSGEHKVARAYVLYRDERTQERRRREEQIAPATQSKLHVRLKDGRVQPLDEACLEEEIATACAGLDGVSPQVVMIEVRRNLYDGILLHEVGLAQTMAARTLVEQEPNYAYVSARLLLNNLCDEALAFVMPRASNISQKHRDLRYEEYFPEFVRRAIDLQILDKELGNFDIRLLASALKHERDRNFQFLGLQTLYDRYFLHKGGVRFELPQAFFMRVAMGLALREIDRDTRAIEFYELLSSFDFMCSTPTLFNAGTLRPQLSSCFLTTISDDLDSIFKAIKDNALLSKYAGGLGNDWSGVRGLGAHIRGTNGESQGIVPFLKVANDTAIAVNQGGKRKGAVCGYLETWHIDIEEFLDLRKNTGDDRRRTHDMNTANWIPDLFMERVEKDGNWTLFSPDEVPDLHDLYGNAFAGRYVFYEAKAQCGEL